MKREFGILLEVQKIDPDNLLQDRLDLSTQEKAELLAEWTYHNKMGQVPVIVFDGEKTESKEDLFRILQEG